MADEIVKPKIPRKARTKKPEMHPMLKWLRSAGAAAFLFGFGSLVLAGWFWPGVGSIDFGFLLLALDLWVEPDLKGRFRWRLSGVLVLLVLAGVFNWKIVFVSAPLEIGALMTNAEYPAGTKISGILWKPKFTEVQVWMNNPTDKSYEDLDLVIRPTTPIAEIAQMSAFPGVSFEDKNNFSVRLMDYDIGDRKASAIPLVLLATDAGYRVRCPHLPSKSALKIVIALADIKWDPKPPAPKGSQSEDFRDKDYILRTKTDDFASYWLGYPEADDYTPRPTSSDWMKVEGEYMVGQRTRSISQRINIGGNLTIKSP